MATMHADASFTHTPRCLGGPSCTGAVFYLRATYTQLTHALGETDTIEHAEPSWVVLVRAADNQRAERVAIHHTSTRPRTEPDEPTLWYVTAYHDGLWAAERLSAALGEIVEFTTGPRLNLGA
ncbi:hypothetical protein [Nocardia sp. XZ_19_369]|uniref:hypothetical protein n=1 Tax=Nocardia sp. XZ_19_369 TaxID=2769487 RepID=UPI00188FB0D1|nr:hypothetical protein [Nocardia sp. XZ_19_369]